MSATFQKFRVDTKSQKLQWEKLPNGAYRAFITLGVADLPLEYVDSSGNKHTETIASDELFNDDSLASAYGLPVCFSHPLNGEYDNNREKLLIGHTLESFLNQDNKLLMPCIIDDFRGIELIDSMITSGTYAEVSPGYWISDLLLDQKSKTYKQIGRRYDHIALLEAGEGRGGQNVILRTDNKFKKDMAISTRILTTNNQSTETSTDDYGTVTTEITSQTTMKTTYQDKDYSINSQEDLDMMMDDINNKTSEMSNDSDMMMDSKNKKIQSLETEVKLQTKKAIEAQSRHDALKLQLDSKKNLIPVDEANQRTKECVELWQQLEPVFKADASSFIPDYSLSPVQIKELYLSKFKPGLTLDAANAEFRELRINTLWDVCKLDLPATLEAKINQDSANKVQNQLSELSNLEILNIDKIQADSEFLNLDAVKKASQKETARIASNHRSK